MSRWSNCLVHAVGRWVTRGGWLLMRKSHAGPYPHFLHADKLPESLEVSHFVPDTRSRWPDWRQPLKPFLFRGRVHDSLMGQSPEHTGRIDFALLLFWVPYLVGAWGMVSWVAGWLMEIAK